MDTLKYAETVVEQAHIKTLRGELQWTTGRDKITADPTSSISISIKFEDDGPDSAIWEYVIMTHPVGKDMTMIGNPASPKASFCKFQASGQILDQANEMFRYVLLDPRKKQFAVAMRELCE